MIVHRAAWLLPIARPPIRDGWVAVEAGRIAALGGPADRLPAIAFAEIRPARPIAVLPGLVNAHTHLELSWMQGLVPPAASMPGWVVSVMELRRSSHADPQAPVERALAEMRATGTVLAGDVTNTLAAYPALLAHREMAACVFYELLGFNAPDTDGRVADAQRALNALPHAKRLTCSVVPHAPYSVSPALFRSIATASAGRVVSVHLGESEDEIEFLHHGTGAWRVLLERLGVWTPHWTPPGCGPVEYLERFGLVNERLLAVHGVHLAESDLRRLAHAGATVVTCPRSNRWTGAGIPPVARFYDAGVRVAVGTDSLAGVEDLNMFAELAAIRALAPAVPVARLLESATRSGAEALGFGGELGTIEPGKRAALVAVRVPPAVPDVEEYLVSGIDPSAIRWLGTDDEPGT